MSLFRSFLRPTPALLVVSALLVLYILGREGDSYREPPATGAPSGQTVAPPAPIAPASPTSDDDVVARAFKSRTGNVWVTLNGTVTHVLLDDTRGSKHQRFLVRLHNGMTLLVAHNIDLAPRVPLTHGSVVRLRGEYEWNEKGGVIHWTHHDPRGRHDGGWIIHKTSTYR